MNMLKPLEAEETLNPSRIKRLREKTHAAHERLDNRITGAEPFSSRERYGLFLQVQYRFHRDIEALYLNPALQELLPDLASRRRQDLIVADLVDLGLGIPGSSRPPAFGAAPDIATALGWLYVAEGSNLGAAVLLKRAKEMGLSADFGARHLAGHPEGRGLHWRTFTAALDSVQLNDEEEARVISGGVDAFERVQGFVEEVFE